MGLPITWVSAGRLGPVPFPEGVEGSGEQDPVRPDSAQTLTPAAQPVLSVRQAESRAPGGYRPWVDTLSPAQGELREEMDSMRNLK